MESGRVRRGGMVGRTDEGDGGKVVVACDEWGVGRRGGGDSVVSIIALTEDWRCARRRSRVRKLLSAIEACPTPLQWLVRDW